MNLLPDLELWSSVLSSLTSWYALSKALCVTRGSNVVGNLLWRPLLDEPPQFEKVLATSELKEIN